jgi:hypothetical protein
MSELTALLWDLKIMLHYETISYSMYSSILEIMMWLLNPLSKLSSDYLVVCLH